MTTQTEDLISRCKRRIKLQEFPGWNDDVDEVREAERMKILLKLLEHEDTVYKAANISPRSTAVHVIKAGNETLNLEMGPHNLFFVLLAEELDELEAWEAGQVRQKAEHDSLHR